MNSALPFVARSCRAVVSFGVFFLALAGTAPALTVTGYSEAKNDRFSSGFPNAPVDNVAPSFIGLGYDFSGVGWDAYGPSKGFALLSPKHFLATVHYGGAVTINFEGNDGEIYSYNQQSLQATGYGVVFKDYSSGDLALGTLTTAVDSSITPYAVFDLPATGYTNNTLFLYGHGSSTGNSPRVGATSVLNGGLITTGALGQSMVVTGRNEVQLELGDSSSPGFVAWTDPSGAKQLAIIGNNAAIDVQNGYNFLNYLGRAENVAVMNTMMAGDGYALRFVANADTVWKGGGSFGAVGSWTSDPANSELYIAFDSTAYPSSTSVNLGAANRAARGIIFNPGNAGFTFTSGTFTLDRGGINNYSNQRQTFNTDFVLTEGQYWDGHDGGIDVTGKIDNGGHLLVVQGSATNRLSGVITGSGGLAKDESGILVVSGSNTYSGPTFLHNGTLVVNNAAGSGTGTGNVIVEAGTLAGHGKIAGETTIAKGGRLTAGNIVAGHLPTLDTVNQANNVLTFGSNVSLDGAFSFHLGAYSESVGFTSVTLDNFLATLTLGGDSSFTLDSTSFLGIDDPNSGNAFWDVSHSWTLIEVAGVQSIIGDFGMVDLGTWSQGYFAFSTTGGSGNDLVLSYIAVVPEPGTWTLTISAILLGGLTYRRKRSGNYDG